MKILFFLLLKFLLISHNINSTDVYSIVSFFTHTSKKIQTNNGYEFSISEALGNWQDNKGNYGKSKIIFYVEEFSNTTLIKGLAELTDQNNQTVWFIPERETNQEAGVGKIRVIDSSKKYTFLKNQKCLYAINYLDNRSFLKIKCN